MKFDARSDSSPESKDAFVSWLTSETVSTFQRSSDDPESLKAATFLLVNRGRAAGLELSAIAKVLGVSIARAGLAKKHEDFVLDCAEALDPLAASVHSGSSPKGPWWKFWR